MSGEYNFKRTIPNIIQAIVKAEDTDNVQKYENIMVSAYISVLLYTASLANFIVRYFILSQSLKNCLNDSLIFLLLGIAFDVITRVKIKSHYVTLVISGLSFITTIFVTVRFYAIIGPAVFTAVFLQLLLAVIRISGEMLYSVILATILSVLYICFNTDLNLQMSRLYYIVQAFLLIIVCIITAAVYKLNNDRYTMNNLRLRDVKEKKEEITALYKEVVDSQTEAQRLAYHDHLTGLPNRLFFNEQLNHAIVLARRNAEMIAVMFLDLDGFKMINDSMGHTMGDKLLVEIAKRLSNTLRQSDIVARIGGDEFIVMLEGIKDIEMVKNLAERIHHSFERPFRLNDQDCFVTASIGIAIYPQDGEDAETLVKNADIAMYKAKEAGKNQYIICTSVMKNKTVEAMKLANSLYKALEREELELYYQPQVNCKSGKIIGLEALIRWNHPELGMLLPKEFIPIAEKTGLIIPVGEWVIRTACKQNKTWQDAGYPKIRISVNISVQQFQSPNFVNKVESILKETGLASEYLELEITESIAMKEKTFIAETLNAFKEMGIRITIDDFGTEYSSLDYLKQLSANSIKIAMPFVQGIGSNDKDEAITQAIIVLAKSMGLNVIAEGVETKNQIEFLKKKECNEIQGFYYFRPMTFKEIEKVLKNNIESYSTKS